MSRGLFILALFLFGLQSINAQLDQVWRYTYPEFVEGQENKLFFRLENNNFFKNNEYFGDYTEGYTLIGYTIQPTFMYYAGKKLTRKPSRGRTPIKQAVTHLSIYIPLFYFIIIIFLPVSVPLFDFKVIHSATS